MGEFTAVLQQRIEDDSAWLDAARAAGDDELSDALTGEVENLLRIAAQHGIVVRRS